MHVVAAVDTSPCASPVLNTARALADALESPVHALHVPEGDEPQPPPALHRVPVEVMPGRPTDVILHAFSASGALGVIGARDRLGDQRPVGSTATTVITQVSRPLVVVSPRIRSLRQGRLERVLLPLDGTTDTASSLDDLLAALSEAGLDLAVHHVFEHLSAPAYWDQPQHEAASWAREFGARWCDRPGTSVSYSCGAAADEIVAAADDHHSDLIVLSWAQNAAPGRAEVVRAVLKNAAVPVLLAGTAA